MESKLYGSVCAKTEDDIANMVTSRSTTCRARSSTRQNSLSQSLKVFPQTERLSSRSPRSGRAVASAPPPSRSRRSPSTSIFSAPQAGRGAGNIQDLVHQTTAQFNKTAKCARTASTKLSQFTPLLVQPECSHHYDPNIRGKDIPIFQIDASSLKIALTLLHARYSFSDLPILKASGISDE